MESSRFKVRWPFHIGGMEIVNCRSLRELLQEFDLGGQPNVENKVSQHNSGNLSNDILQLSWLGCESLSTFPPRQSDYRILHCRRVLARFFVYCFTTTPHHLFRFTYNCYENYLQKNVQFALAVHVQPFFNGIVSVSIALAVLTAKSSR